MRFFPCGLGATAWLVFWLPAVVQATTLAPDPVQSSDLILRLERVGAVQRNNLASPVAIGGDLYIVDQDAEILRQTEQGFVTVLDTSGLPDGITAASREPILNIAGDGERAFVAFTSTTLPSGLTAVDALPDDPNYANAQAFQVIYRYDRAADGSLSNPEPLAAFAARTGGHSGGGMLVLPGGQVLFARGDAVRFDLDGLEAPQDLGSTLSKLVSIDPVSGAVEIVAQGLRNPQRLTYADTAQTQVTFADIGAVTAEEINVVTVAALLDTDEIENFGWGRAADGLAREGTFYISPGASAVPNSLPDAVGAAPVPEPGFLQPYAQFGREDVTGPFAVSGPVASDVSFDLIDLLFGDLLSGRLFATLGPGTDGPASVFEVGLVDEDGAAVALLDEVGGSRTDLRLFNFADGTAGALLERTGVFYRLTEVPGVAAVPLPAGGALLGVGLLALWARRRRS